MSVMTSQVPSHYDSTYKHFAAQGARVIALARKRLPQSLSAPELRTTSREEAEHSMMFEGFAVFQVRYMTIAVTLCWSMCQCCHVCCCVWHPDMTCSSWLSLMFRNSVFEIQYLK
jgi:hypothetical protein